MAILTLAIFRIIFSLLRICKIKKPLIKTVMSYFYENSLFKLILVAFIEANMMFLSFHCGIQILKPSCFNTLDKLNMVFSIIFFFVVLIFNFCFYPLIFTWCNKKDAEDFRTFAKFSLRGFCLEALINSGRYVAGIYP